MVLLVLFVVPCLCFWLCFLLVARLVRPKLRLCVVPLTVLTVLCPCCALNEVTVRLIRPCNVCSRLRLTLPRLILTIGPFPKIPLALPTVEKRVSRNGLTHPGLCPVRTCRNAWWRTRNCWVALSIPWLYRLQMCRTRL